MGFNLGGLGDMLGKLQGSGGQGAGGLGGLANQDRTPRGDVGPLSQQQAPFSFGHAAPDAPLNAVV